mmetsp:Transcript_11627/g.33117  ORF Transcript_11627/g.33117 Transcript_11627/m.33117 type:complete len:171 (+) Transcript_11627:66-578(+)
MVRLVPPRLSGLVTLALQARVHQQGLAPMAVDVPMQSPLTAASSVALGGVHPPPTSYRTSQRAAKKKSNKKSGDTDEGNSPQPLVDGGSPVDENDAVNFLPYSFFLSEFRVSHPHLEPDEARKKGNAQWKEMTTEQKAPFYAMAGLMDAGKMEGIVASERAYLSKGASES